MYAFALGLEVDIIGKFIFNKIDKHRRWIILELCWGADIQFNTASDKNRDYSI